MKITLIIDPSRVWAWHATLLAALAADGHDASVQPADETAQRPLPTAYGLIEALEKLTARGPELSHARRLTMRDLSARLVDGREPCDLSIDLASAGAAARNDDRALAVMHDGGDEHRLLLALCDNRIPDMTLRLNATGAIIGEARPAIERPQALTPALDHYFARALTLCRMAPRLILDRAAHRAPSIIDETRPRAFAPAAMGLAARAIAARLLALVKTAPRWRVGYRIGATDRVIDRGRWPDAGYTMLPDDGRRFFADPFPFWRDGVCHVFVEEYPFETGKGVISRFTLDAQGRATTPRVILEHARHLSYPMIFERHGEIWMIPESSSAGTIELYRADPFPDRWILDRVLVDDVIASDMTLTEHGGKLWLLGSIAEQGGSTWDGLGAFFADNLSGEWKPHPANPLLIDASCARPAGMTVATSAGLIRPVQDCRARYGGALALARIDRLDEESFAQTVIARLPPDPRWSAIGAHTLNESNGVETVDWIA